MVVALPDTPDRASRKRRAHKKSRRGCENCKIRRVKCDETRPRCQRCLSFGIDCNYDSSTCELKFAGESTFALQKPQRPACGTDNMIVAMYRTDDTATNGLIRGWSQPESEIFSRFQGRTILTIGTKQARNIYQNDIFKLAISHRFLRHIAFTLTLLHDLYLAGTPSIDESAALHWYKGTAEFKEALIKPTDPSERDALWASAAILSCISFAAIEARTPEEAWPLKPPSNQDLDWLNMSQGKHCVWKIADPSRPESIFHSMRGHPDLYRPLVFSGKDLTNITTDFCDVFDLGPTSSSEDNPYHSAAMILARLLTVDCNSENLIEFLTFMSRIDPKLKALLEHKEPKALLLIACWFAKVYNYQWWIHRRGLLEGQAICIYLDRYYSHATGIQRILQFPKTVFGLSFPSTSSVKPLSVSSVSQPIPVR